MLTENDIARISLRIVQAYAPLAVGTFGSYAIGSASDRSDLDLFLIRETYERPVARARAVQRLLFGVLHPLDVHVFTPDEFEETTYEVLSFTWVIARQARLYHWTDAAARLVPSLQARADACRHLANGRSDRYGYSGEVCSGESDVCDAVVEHDQPS
jgi:predicted nucleotidyltransferase